MKQLFNKKSFLLICFFMSVIPLHADDSSINVPSPFLFIRSQGRDKVHQVVGSVGHTHLTDEYCWWSDNDALLVYEQSFNSLHIAENLFGTIVSTPTTINCCNIEGDETCKLLIQIQGSQVPNRNEQIAWLADYFYLPPDFSSTISFKPQIRNVLIVLDKYIGMDPLLCGLYLRLYGPITFSKWDLDFCEFNVNRGTIGYHTGYFNHSVDPTTEILFDATIGQSANGLLHSFTDYASGLTPQAAAIRNDGIVLQPLKFAKIRTKSKNRSGFADLRFELGWDFLACDCAHLGFNVQGAAPTGSRIEAEFLFDPIIGNGRHWEVGGGVTAHYTFWYDESGDQSLSANLDANFTHLFRAKQQRTFDLKNKPNSRYMLAEKLGTPVVNLFGSPIPGVIGTNVPSLQFKNEFAPVANLTTTDIKVSIGVQADIVAWLNYMRCNWSFDLGYNFWGTTKEKICINTCENQCLNPLSLCNASQQNTWALKGDAQVFGFVMGSATSVALSATESAATINTGTNANSNGPFMGIINNFGANYGVDNAQFASDSTDILLTTPFHSIATAAQVKTSVDPITLSCNDINFIRHQGFTHKVFIHASYNWQCECLMPYLGIGGSAEFDQRKRNRTCSTRIVTTNNCKTTGDTLRSVPSFWSIWIKGGVTFN